ncbi:MAG: hypothetical protein ACTSPB_00025 [Candidatus Thorarchaeota archaeon]
MEKEEYYIVEENKNPCWGKIGNDEYSSIEEAKEFADNYWTLRFNEAKPPWRIRKIESEVVFESEGGE